MVERISAAVGEKIPDGIVLKPARRTGGWVLGNETMRDVVLEAGRAARGVVTREEVALPGILVERKRIERCWSRHGWALHDVAGRCERCAAVLSRVHAHGAALCLADCGVANGRVRWRGQAAWSPRVSRRMTAVL